MRARRYPAAPPFLLLPLVAALGLPLPPASAREVPAAPAPAPADDPAEAKPKPKAKAEPIEIPFRLLPSNHMAVQTRINGKGPYWLVFDVGAPITLVSTALNKELGLSGSARGGLFGVNPDAKAKTFEVGGAVVDDLPLIVMDHPAVRALSSPATRLQGIVGYTFFARYRATIDYQARVMTLEPVDFRADNLLESLTERMAGPRRAREIPLAPLGLWGFRVGEPEGGLEARGVPVLEVVPGSPAERAGLKPGDVLATLDGRWTLSPDDVHEAAAKVKPDVAAEGVPAVVLREGRETTLSIRPRPGF